MTADTMSEAIALSSPSGSMSKAARARALERLRVSLFGPDGLEAPTCRQPTKIDRLLHEADELRGLADRGMHPRSYRRAAEVKEALALALAEAGEQ